MYPWEKLRKAIIEQGGIAHSVLVAYMPGEASSKALGGANSIYPIRRRTIVKTDNNVTIQWAAPYGDNPAYKYQSAWDVPTRRLIQAYAVFQKWTDQGISADLFRRILPGQESITSDELIEDWLLLNFYGVKTRYYHNVETSGGVSLDANVSAFVTNTDNAEVGCAGGACSL
ncbi:Ribonucleoside-diphosphate reductase 1 subunit alpha [compost metagenome]